MASLSRRASRAGQRGDRPALQSCDAHRVHPAPHRAARPSCPSAACTTTCTPGATPALATPERPPLVLLHGWMDVGASFQFVVDALAAADGFERWVIAPDWRGFGLTAAPAADTYWFPDYLGDLDALLDRCSAPPAGRPIDLLGHSMGGNVVMSYAGVRAARMRRLVNLEGFGLPETQPHQAPRRLAQWLDELKTPAALRSYDSLQAVAERLLQEQPAAHARQGGLAGAALVAPGRRRPLAHPRRPGTQARQPGALPQGRGAGDLEADHRAGAVGGRRPHRHHASGGATATRAAISKPGWPSCPGCSANGFRPAATCCTTTSRTRWPAQLARFLA